MSTFFSYSLFYLIRRQQHNKIFSNIVQSSRYQYMDTLKLPTCSVVICTRNRPNHVWRCLASIKNQTVQPTHIVIIENVHEGQYFSQGKIADFFDDKIPCIYRHTHAHNLAYSRNISLASCADRILVSIDDDAIFPDSHTLENILSLHKEYPTVTALVGPVTPLSSSGWAAYSAALHCYGLHQAPAITYLRAYPATSFSLKTASVKRTHVHFDTTLDGGDDILFFWNLTRHGEKLLYHPSIKIQAEFPDSIVQFFKKQMSYTVNYVPLYTKTQGKIDGISWMFPHRILHIALYPIFLCRESVKQSYAELTRLRESKQLIGIAFFQHCLIAAGALWPSVNRQVLLSAMKQCVIHNKPALGLQLRLNERL